MPDVLLELSSSNVVASVVVSSAEEVPGAELADVTGVLVVGTPVVVPGAPDVVSGDPVPVEASEPLVATAGPQPMAIVTSANHQKLLLLTKRV